MIIDTYGLGFDICKVECLKSLKEKAVVCTVINPDECSDKQLVKYLNCNGLQIQNMQKKECQ